MSSVVGKRVNGRTYYYLVTSGRVDGKPRITSQRYLGSADDIAAALDGGATTPSRTWQLSFGPVAAAWRQLTSLDVVRTVDDVVGAGRGQVSVGGYVALAILHRIDRPGMPLDLDGWWPTTAAERFVRPRIARGALEPRRVRRALGRITDEHVAEIQRILAPRLLDEVESALALDIPDFAVLDGLVGMTYLVSVDGAVPLLAVPRRHGTSLRSVLGDLVERYPTDVTVVAGPGRRAQAELGSRLGLGFIDPLAAGEHPDLIRTGRETSVAGMPGVTYTERRATLDGVQRRVIAVASESLRAAQDRELQRNLSLATGRLDEVSEVIAGRTREAVQAEIARITSFRWAERVLWTRLDGDELRWSVDDAALDRLRTQRLGRQLLTTDRHDWSASRVITAYRARYRLESTVRHLDGPLAPWSERMFPAQALISVLATTVAHVLRREAQQAGLDLSVRELLAQLSGITETVLRYPSTGGRPRTARLLTDRDPTRELLVDLFL